MEKGIDFSKENVYEAIGRPDLAPTKREMFTAFAGQDLGTVKTYLQGIISSWNGEDSWFMHEGERFHEDTVGCAEEIIEKIDELQVMLDDFAS